MTITKTDKPADGDTSAARPAGSVEAAHSQSAVDRAAEQARLAAASGPDPYPPYDLMTLGELRAVAAELGVELPPDVEKALWISELRAFRSGTLSTARRRTLP